MNKANKKIIGITGGKGMLGSDIRSLAEKEGYKTIVYDLPEFDITSPEDIQKAVSTCDVIVNCAAYTAVDDAESNPELAEAVNATAVKNLGIAAKLAGKYVLHVSTDFVFGDNEDIPLSETSETNPLGVYGATKLQGEELLKESGCKHSILRVEWTYGKNGDNFITKIINLSQKHDKLKVVDDQIGSPTSTEEVAKAVICMLKSDTEGLYHFATEGYASRYDVAKFIFNELNINVDLNPCSSSEFPAPAQRPENSRFNCTEIDKILDFKRELWKDSLKKFISKIT